MLPIIREIASNSFIPSRWSMENFTVTGDERQLTKYDLSSSRAVLMTLSCSTADRWYLDAYL